MAKSADKAPRRGRGEAAFERALTSAKASDYAPEGMDAALIAAGRMVARGLDIAERRGDPFALSQLMPRYLEVLEALRLLPAARKDQGTDAFAQFLAEISRPPVCDPEAS